MRDRATYDGRCRHKLNMLEPGMAMLKCAAALMAAGGVCAVLAWRTAARIALAAGGAVFAAMMVLVAIELHQDRVLNEIAARENARTEERK